MSNKPALGRGLARGAAFALAVLWAGAALAAPSKQDVAKADKLFREAKTLMGQNKLAEACPKLEQSQKLDPAPGTQYQLAVCYEGTDRPATALAYYIEVADLAKAAGYKDKEKVSRDKAAALEPKVPRITLQIASKDRASGMVVTRDGVAVEESRWNRPILVDPGEYTIEATAPGKKSFSSRVAVKGQGAQVTVPIALADAEDFARRDELPPPPPPPTKTIGGQRIAAIVVGVLGLGGVGVGSYFGITAKSTYEKAIGDPKLCPTHTACYPDGKRLVNEAQTDATISTIAFVAGGVAVAGGVILFATGKPAVAAPSSGLRKPGASATLVPALGPGFAGVTALGSF